GRDSGTLVNALLYHCEELSDGSDDERPGIVHRLDRETSGVMIVVKNNETHVTLARQFEKHKVVKRYVALVKGCVEQDEGEIDAPIARHPLYFDKKTISYNAEQSKSAYTFYKVLRRFERSATLVALLPKTGRTHQLRVHMKHLGHPVLGDDKYGDARSFPRLALHAQSVCFWHPGYQSFLECSVPLPQELLHPEKFFEHGK
ncbi:MAG TPA: RluA family pseudouridine synthase, partial [Candidatus Bathyarchaeia archaeon]|nr:RluA family pseudouridine synthase [Candidatus Bathyarchaeia archaeon]